VRFSPLNAPSPLQLNMHRHLWACLATLALVASACAIERAAVHDHLAQALVRPVAPAAAR